MSKFKDNGKSNILSNNYFVNKDDPESIRQWNQYLKTQPTIEGGKLKDLVKNKKRLNKILNYDILR